MKISSQLVRGATHWVLTWYETGRRRRKFFTTEPAAQRALEARQKQIAQGGKWWAGLSEAEQIEIGAVVAEVKRAGRTLREVWDGFRNGPAARVTGPSVSLRKAINGMLTDKRMANYSRKYIEHLDQLLSRFATGREALPVEQVTSEMVKEFLGQFANIGSRKTWRARISALFSWCVRTKQLAANPVDELESIRSEAAGAPEVLEPEQAELAFHTAAKWPRFLRWFTLGIMCGLRPEEADQVTKEMVRGDWEIISLPGTITKTRRPRVIEVPEAARAWLRRCKDSAPLSLVQRRRYLRRLRDALKFKVWPRDLLRHTAASYLLTKTQDLGLVSRMLGNSVAVLNRHYINPRTKEEAAAFWALDGSLKVLVDAPEEAISPLNSDSLRGK